MHKDAGNSVIVILRPAGTAHHLQHVCNGHVNIATGFAIVVFGAFNDDKVSWEVDAPAEHERSLGKEISSQRQFVSLTKRV